jgi:hypothetical protein
MPGGTALPAGFAALEPFIAQWALPSAAARSSMRESNDLQTLRAFYEAAKPRLQQALTYLDGIALAEYGPQEDCLMKLMLSLAHVSLAVEVQADSEPSNAIDRRHMRITRTTADN